MIWLNILDITCKNKLAIFTHWISFRGPFCTTFISSLRYFVMFGPLACSPANAFQREKRVVTLFSLWKVWAGEQAKPALHTLVNPPQVLLY